MSSPDALPATDLWVRRGDAVVPDDDLLAVTVEQDVDQPSMCVLTLADPADAHARAIRLGDRIEIRVGGPAGAALFHGEVVGVEPTYRAGAESRCVVRGFDRLHRLRRGRRSRTFVGQRDGDIARVIAADHGLDAVVDPTPIVHPHVYQHDQTDLEFLRLRAARIGFELAVVDRTLHLRRRRLDLDSGVVLAMGDAPAAGLLTRFSPRLSSAGVVSEVEVRGWDPDRKRAIVARAVAGASRLGRIGAAQATARAFGSRVTYALDPPVASVEEAQAVAEARLQDLLLDYVTGEGAAVGDPAIRPGIVVRVDVDPAGAGPFDGRYLVVGASHRYQHGAGGEGGGYTTAFRVRRDAEGEA